jgi:hypothetical protein
MRPDTIKSAHCKFGMPVFAVKLFGRDSHTKRATAWFERHGSSTAAEHHRSQREAPFGPSLKAAGKWSNTLKSTAVQRKGYPCAGELMRSGTVKDDLAIARDWRSLVGMIMLSQPMRIEAHRTGNAVMASPAIPAAVQINNHDFFARVQLLFKLFWRDPSHSKFAHHAMPLNKLAANIHS